MYIMQTKKQYITPDTTVTVLGSETYILSGFFSKQDELGGH